MLIAANFKEAYKLAMKNKDRTVWFPGCGIRFVDKIEAGFNDHRRDR